MNFLLGLSPFLLVCLGGLLVWLGTSLGSATVFFMSTPKRKIIDVSLGFSWTNVGS